LGDEVTCYFRHLESLFKKAGITVTTQNKAELDRIIHGIVGVDHKNCPEAWRKVKKRIAEDEEDFIAALRNAWNGRQMAF
jgi:hypothetical protein